MLISFIRTVILYSILILVIRLMGKRQLGEMEPMEFVVTMLLANLAAVPMQETGIPLLAGLIPILVVLSMELLLSVLVYHSVHARRLLCGKPVILMENGRLLQDNMKKNAHHTGRADRVCAHGGHHRPFRRQIRDSGNRWADQHPALHKI